MRLLTLAGFCLLTLAIPLSAQSDSEQKKIPEAYRKFFQKAVVAYEQQKFDEALLHLDAADGVYPNYAETYNLQGGIYTQQRNFEEARKLFTKALGLNENSYPVRFNLAEIEFLEKNYPKAREKFEELEDRIAKDDEVNPDSIANLVALVKYKIFLTYLLENEMEEAERLQSEFSFTDTTPNYYFANAAMAFQKGDEREAQEWLASADRIYAPQMNRLYADSFFEVGWIDKPEMPSAEKSE